MNKSVAIIGNGWVGKAMQDLFPDATTYVRDVMKLSDEEATTYSYTDMKEVINLCDIAFICVPTPSAQSGVVDKDTPNERVVYEGELDTSAVEECIAWLETPLIVVRSTVNPGDCIGWERKYNKTILFQPEYLGETPEHPLLNTVKTPFLVIGGQKRKDRRKLIELYQEVYNANITIRQMPLLETEIVKLTENRAIAFKVAQCQELYDVCELANVDFYQIREAVYNDDPRMNLWWTFVYPNNRGFNSKCIPKDIYAWCAWAESLGYNPKITRMILEKNKSWIEQE